VSESAGRTEHLFIVRLWQEKTSSGEWRGFVEHVPSQQRIYFVSLNDLTDFIRLRLGDPRSGETGRRFVSDGGPHAN
jgi:hypothetical protein